MGRAIDRWVCQVHVSKTRHVTISVCRYRARVAGPKALALPRVQIPTPRQKFAWKARYCISGQAKSDLRPRLFLASSRSLRESDYSAFQSGLLACENGVQPQARCSSETRSRKKRMERISRLA